jgi:hypothetical protein
VLLLNSPPLNALERFVHSHAGLFESYSEAKPAGLEGIVAAFPGKRASTQTYVERAQPLLAGSVGR